MLPVAAALIEHNGKVLIAKRKPERHLPGCWEFPGGKIDAGETAEECIVRELREEFTVETTVVKFLAETHHKYETVTIQLFGFIMKWVSGEFQLIDHDEIAWVEPAEIRNYNLAPADFPLLEAYLQQLLHQPARR